MHSFISTPRPRPVDSESLEGRELSRNDVYDVKTAFQARHMERTYPRRELCDKLDVVREPSPRILLLLRLRLMSMMGMEMQVLWLAMCVGGA
jgi:hypothetical protein